eukprot:NODE_6732_length_850_cov_35.411279_g6134_i0.p1 GENE.NODE_6732_length_850_cov_35.411279_g6134_i0~~NODE_6732_length_850_cov_35.411279_g6134_i0.p1  ORF type:complete len:277 (+),score=49.18 NODE_6732_length_850_cov_35.411279_g6134_i0:60-833(+)
MVWQHRVALITGAASGLGKATAVHLHSLGAKVLFCDLDKVNGTSVVQSLNSDRALFVTTDVCSTDSVTHALDICKKFFGKDINVAVNCAGIGIAAKLLGKGGAHSMESFSKVISVNLFGTFNVARLAAQRMALHSAEPDEERGVIINTASVAAFDGQVGQCAYAASKAAVAGLTLPMARDLMDTGIRVVTLAPGLFLTPMLKQLPESTQQSLAKGIPFPKRFGKPEEFAHAVQFIVENGYVNGEVIRIDGSLRMSPK